MDYQLNIDFFDSCIRGHPGNLEVTFNRGVDPNVQDVYGRTGLMHASARGHIECVRILLERGADPNVKDKRGKTALWHASTNDHIECADLLSAAFKSYKETNK
jgi:ankyrin repeat protein